jgi:hypothetical protein
MLTAGPASADRRVNDVRPARSSACTRVIASDASYDDVKPVGVIANGKTRKLLVLIRSKGFIVLPGECVGRERVPYERIFEHVLPPPAPPAAPPMVPSLMA